MKRRSRFVRVLEQLMHITLTNGTYEAYSFDELAKLTGIPKCYVEQICCTLAFDNLVMIAELYGKEYVCFNRWYPRKSKFTL